MITAEKLKRVKEAGAAKTHMPRSGGDGYGATVASGGNVNLPPVAVERYDGLITVQRLNDLARMCGKGGFVVSARTGNRPQIRRGYAVSVHPERETWIGGFVKGRDILEYMIRNWDLLSDPRALVSARRNRKTGVTELNVCTVVGNRERARLLSQVHESSSFVDMRDGKIEKV